jgi:hypothetical protein
MDIFEQMLQASRVDAADRYARHCEQSRNRLLAILEKKIKTSFIGPISEFELAFGQLWGHGLDPVDCTDAQLARRARWEQVRNNILNSGNRQLRAVQAELNQHDVSWKRYHTEFQIKGAK